MAVFSACKVVATLPGVLAANTLYLVRVGTGFRPYVTNSTPTIVAYPLDPITWSELGGIPANLSAIAGLTSAANKVAYFNGAGTAALADLSSFGRTLIGASSATAGLQALGAAWLKLDETAITSATASYTLTGLSGFRKLRISGLAVPATTNVAFGLRLSTNNGSSYDATTNRYFWRYVWAAAGLTGGTSQTSDTTRFQLNDGVNSADGVNFELTLHDFNQARNCAADWRASARRQGTTDTQIASGGGYFALATARDAFQLAFGSGNISSAHILVEGLV